MWGGIMLMMDGRLVSCCSSLPGTLLPFGSSWFLLSMLVPSWSSSWVLRFTFFWRNYSSRSWFCLVRRSMATVRVWTCLSRAVVRGSSPWTSLVVSIEWVSTMQLFVRKVIVWLINRKRFPQTTPTDDAEKITNELHNPYALTTIPAQQKEKT